jgi:type I restriction enzyme S subunit
VKVTLPPLPEQQKIAKILATWDKAIKLQQELIYNKKQYKKAVMKKLLTGEVRFKGFSEKWQEYHLGFLGNTYSGLSGKSKEDFGIGLPYIPYKNIYGNPSIDITYMDYVNIKPIENQNQVIYGDIFFTVSSETPDEVGMSSVLLDKSIEELYLNSFCFGFRLNDFKTLLPEFASHYFRGDKFRFEMLKAAQGATRFNLSKSNVTKLKIVIPSVAEQLKIASFLSGIDKETKALECELLYFQKQKQGLMQQLLTGKIRVKN